MTILIEEVAIVVMNSKKSNTPATYNFTEESAKMYAAKEGISLNSDHMEVLHSLQDYYIEHNNSSRINVRELHDALNEKYHHKGGMKFLYSLFPGGPIAQGCRLAGLPPPVGATDKGFGSTF
jgi:tRNA 2-thiouridine synthesizing protein E